MAWAVKWSKHRVQGVLFIAFRLNRRLRFRSYRPRRGLKTPDKALRPRLTGALPIYRLEPGSQDGG